MILLRDQMSEDLVDHGLIDNEGHNPHLAVTAGVLRSILLYLIHELLKERHLVFGRC